MSGSGMAFYGVTLSEENKSETWKQKLYSGPAIECVTKLAVKLILLGHDAKKDEVNVVEVTTDSWKRDGPNQKIPIAVLKLGESQATLPNLEFPSLSVKFSLVKGSGPVHITGLQFPDPIGETLEGEQDGGLSEGSMDDEGSNDFDEEEEEPEDEEQEAAAEKAKPSKVNLGKKK